MLMYRPPSIFLLTISKYASSFSSAPSLQSDSLLFGLGWFIPQRERTSATSSSDVSLRELNCGNPEPITIAEIKFPKIWFNWKMQKNIPKNSLTFVSGRTPVETANRSAETVKYCALLLHSGAAQKPRKIADGILFGFNHWIIWKSSFWLENIG